jgi:hypothetical protein
VLKLKKFDWSTTYMFVDGTLATPEIIHQRNPAVDHFTHVLELNGDVVQAIMALSALREIYKIDPLLTEDEAILALEVITNTPPPVVISAEERMASAMEFSNLMTLETPLVVAPKTMLLDGKEVAIIKTVAEDAHATLLKQNYDRGLWSEPMLAKAVEKGVITIDQHDEITLKAK